MDRAGLETPNWSNPELVHVDYANHVAAAKSEPFDASTVDPSHIIHLIRQLLPSGTRTDSVHSKQLPVGSGVESLVSTVGGVSSGRNGNAREALNAVESGTVYKKDITQTGQEVGRPSTGQDRGNISSTGCARESASTGFSVVDPKCLERSTVIIVNQGNHEYIEENGNHTEENSHHSHANGDFNNGSCREGGKTMEQSGGSPDGVHNSELEYSERVSEVILISSTSFKKEGSMDRIAVKLGGDGVGRQLEDGAYQKSNGEEDAREEAGCVLWDLAANESHAEFLVEHHILDVLLCFLRVPHLDRMREICLGIFGNLACHSGPVKAMVATEGLVETLVQQLFVDNIPSLTEACRLLSAGLHSEATVTWVESIKPDHVLERILWMAANTLNTQLLEKCTELILVMVDSRRDAAAVLLPSLLRLGLPGLLTELMACELSAISEGTSSRGDLVLDIVLQIAEAISIPDDSASELAASDKLFSLSCQVIRLSSTDEIGPSAITATVLIANLLTEEAGLIQQVLHDPIFLGRLSALLPCAGDDPGARNALWSILGRICRWLISTELGDPCHGTSGMIAVLADGCSLLLDDLDIHLEDDLEEDEDRKLAGHDAAASISRGLQAKLATVCNMMRTMDQWISVHGGSSAQDIPLFRSVRNACAMLKKYIASNEISSRSDGRDSNGLVENGGFIHPATTPKL